MRALVWFTRSSSVSIERVRRCDVAEMWKISRTSSKDALQPWHEEIARDEKRVLLPFSTSGCRKLCRFKKVRMLERVVFKLTSATARCKLGLLIIFQPYKSNSIRGRVCFYMLFSPLPFISWRLRFHRRLRYRVQGKIHRVYRRSTDKYRCELTPTIRL